MEEVFTVSLCEEEEKEETGAHEKLRLSKSLAPASAKQHGIYSSMLHSTERTTTDKYDHETNLRKMSLGGCPLHWNNVQMSVPDTSPSSPSSSPHNDKDKCKDKHKKKTKEKCMKHILKGVSGSAYNGELTGIIGSSGGGKTTLLSILGGRIASIDSLVSKHAQVCLTCTYTYT